MIQQKQLTDLYNKHIKELKAGNERSATHYMRVADSLIGHKSLV